MQCSFRLAYTSRLNYLKQFVIGREIVVVTHNRKAARAAFIAPADLQHPISSHVPHYGAINKHAPVRVKYVFYSAAGELLSQPGTTPSGLAVMGTNFLF